MSTLLTNVNYMFNSLKGVNINNTRLDTTNVDASHGFMFSGRQTFCFENLHLSYNQDILTAYSDPSRGRMRTSIFMCTASCSILYCFLVYIIRLELTKRHPIHSNVAN
jgi:hypothetical protein